MLFLAAPLYKCNECTCKKLTAANENGQSTMESPNAIVRSALKQFLDHVQRDTSEWFYASNTAWFAIPWHAQ